MSAVLKIAGAPLCRVATLADEEKIMDCLAALNADNGMGFPYSEARVRHFVRMFCQGQGGVIGVIEGLPGRIDATVAIMAEQMIYSEQWFLNEKWLFVRPLCRHGGIYARALIEFMRAHRREMSKRVGYDLRLITAPVSNNRLAAKMRWWSRFGRQIGGFFEMDD